MSLDERDYMRRPRKELRGSVRSWWQNIKLESALGIALSIFLVGSAAIYFFRDIGDVAGGFGSSEGSLIVNINTADTDELETLPGIGPALASLIVTGRPYTTVDELDRVRGIGPSLVQSLRPLVTVEGDTRDAD